MASISMRDSFFDRLYELAQKNRNIILVSADMGAPSLDKFRRDLAPQFVNVGIAEQNMITVASGLALSGKKVFVYAIMPFATLRCFELIKCDLSLMKLPVTVVGVGAGFSYDDSGPTHHSTEDISVMRVLPHFTIHCPSDSVMAARCADISCALKTPDYVRLDRHIFVPLYSQKETFKAGFSVLREGRDVAIISMGNMVHRALEAANELKKKKVSVSVIDLYRPKPFPTTELLKIVRSHKAAVTLEEHLLAGGLGSLVAEMFADHGCALPLKRVGIDDKYLYAYGGRENIQDICGLDAASVVKAAQNVLAKRTTCCR
jgi:transketolase